MLARCVIQLSYGIIGIFSYFLVFYAMFGVRKILSRNFIVIYAMMAATNIATWLNAWIFLKLRVEPSFHFYYEWVQGLPLLVTIHSFLVNHFYFAQNIDLLLLTFDRFATMLSLVKNTKWWNKSYLGIALSLHIIVLAVHLIPRLPLSVKIQLDNDTGTYEISYDDNSNSFFTNMQIVVGFAVTLLCLILNVLTLLFLRKLRKTRHASTEISFIILSCCIFLTQLLNFLIAFQCMISLSYQKKLGSQKILFEIMYFTSDLFCLGPALYTIILPGPIRRFLIGKVMNCLHTRSTDNGHSPTS